MGTPSPASGFTNPLNVNANCIPDLTPLFNKLCDHHGCKKSKYKTITQIALDSFLKPTVQYCNVYNIYFGM
jgi:hypothetical protein